MGRLGYCAFIFILLTDPIIYSKIALTGAGAGAGCLKGLNCGSAAYCCWRFAGR
jgi:hypothetical protein